MPFPAHFMPSKVSQVWPPANDRSPRAFGVCALLNFSPGTAGDYFWYSLASCDAVNIITDYIGQFSTSFIKPNGKLGKPNEVFFNVIFF